MVVKRVRAQGRWRLVLIVRSVALARLENGLQVACLADGNDVSQLVIRAGDAALVQELQLGGVLALGRCTFVPSDVRAGGGGVGGDGGFRNGWSQVGLGGAL